MRPEPLGEVGRRATIAASVFDRAHVVKKTRRASLEETHRDNGELNGNSGKRIYDDADVRTSSVIETPDINARDQNFRQTARMNSRAHNRRFLGAICLITLGTYSNRHMVGPAISCSKVIRISG